MQAHTVLLFTFSAQAMLGRSIVSVALSLGLTSSHTMWKTGVSGLPLATAFVRANTGWSDFPLDNVEQLFRI